MTQSEKASSAPLRIRAATLAVAAACAALHSTKLQAQEASSSPLSILQAAPKVRINQENVIPVSPTRTQNAPARQPFAPATETDSQLKRPVSAAPTEAAPAPEAEVTPSLPPPDLIRRPPIEHTPQPEKRKKEGFMRGMIRAIPLVGPKIAGPKREEASETPEPEPEKESDTESSSEPAESAVRDETTPLLRPIEPTRAIVPTQQRTQPAETSPQPAQPRSALPPKRPARAADTNPDNVLTVKIPADTPAVASSATTAGIVMEDAKPATQTHSSANVTSESPALSPKAVAPVRHTSPTLMANDLGMPNPAYEENEAVRGEYIAAVQKGRNGNHAEAARLFREYGANHSASGLAPRALFLAALLSPDSAGTLDAETALKERFPDSHFVGELKKRQGSDASTTQSETALKESPAQIAARLEQQLTESVGTVDTEVPLRLQLGQAYMTLEDYERALEVMIPARELAKDRPEEPDILVLISECWIATRKNAEAEKTLEEALERFPQAQIRPRAAYDQGLVNEAAGNFERARALYSEVRLKWPGTAEATQAEERLKDLNKLAE